MKRTLLGWLVVLAIVVVGATIKGFLQTDAQRNAEMAETSEKVRKFIGAHDKSGNLNLADALVNLSGSFFNSCKATVTSTDPRAALANEDKDKYCTCAALGMLKLYYSKLPNAELVERAKYSDQGPSNIQSEVFAACNASLGAYTPPRSPQP